MIRLLFKSSKKLGEISPDKWLWGCKLKTSNCLTVLAAARPSRIDALVIVVAAAVVCGRSSLQTVYKIYTTPSTHNSLHIVLSVFLNILLLFTVYCWFHLIRTVLSILQLNCTSLQFHAYQILRTHRQHLKFFSVPLNIFIHDPLRRCML